MLQPSLMRFDLRSEKLDLFNILPTKISSKSHHFETLIIYKGKVAIVTKSASFKFYVWAIDQDAQNHEWLMIISFRILTRSLRVIGTTHTGEFILAPSSYSDDVYVAHYNPGTNDYREIKFMITKLSPHCYRRAMVFSDYLENVRLMSKRNFMI
ncbi:F-box protein [Cardamine amara subsp. amara]|uniref:F-box protein n=1 Tax=Cardamine amara subsp. amara TaxID=228776 RepID=A0ABD1AGG8_CARAN